MYRRGFQGAMLLVVLLFVPIAHAQTPSEQSSSDMCLMAFEKGFNRCALGKTWQYPGDRRGPPYHVVRNYFFSNPYFNNREYCVFKATQAMDEYYLHSHYEGEAYKTIEWMSFELWMTRPTAHEVLKHALHAFFKCTEARGDYDTLDNQSRNNTLRGEYYEDGDVRHVFDCALDHYSQCLLSKEHNFEKHAPFSATCMGRKNAMYIKITNQGEKRAIKFPLYFERTPERKLLDGLAIENNTVNTNTILGYDSSFIQRGQDYIEILNKIEVPKQRLAEASKIFSPEELANGEMEWWTQRNECSTQRDKCGASNFYHQHSKKNSNMMIELRQLCLKRPNHVRRTLYYSCQDYPPGRFINEISIGHRYDDAVYLCDKKETGNAEKDKETCYNLYETGSLYWKQKEKRIRTLKQFLCQPLLLTPSTR